MQRIPEGEISLRELARAVALHAEAFEALDYDQVQEGQSLALALERQADYSDEGCEYQAEVERLLSFIQHWLSRVAA